MSMGSTSSCSEFRKYLAALLIYLPEFLVAAVFPFLLHDRSSCSSTLMTLSQTHMRNNVK